MKALATHSLAVLLLAAIAPAAVADEVITVMADSTLDGHAGFVVHSVRDGVSGQSIFVFEENDKLRIYAYRAFGQSEWAVEDHAQYLCPTVSVPVGTAWNYLADDMGVARVAGVVRTESVTVPAGTFSAHRVEIITFNDPSTPVGVMWFVDGVGWAQSEGLFPDGKTEWREVLLSYQVTGGTGYMPIAVGNTWTLTEGTVSSALRSMGDLKSRY
jgi:hypothetical protein